MDTRFTAFRDRYGFSGATLKIIAIITMMIDHTAASVIRKMMGFSSPYIDPGFYRALVNSYSMMRQIGRIAFPLFCFFLVEGFLHTHSIKRYAKRLTLFALISEPCFDLALHPERSDALTHQNVYWTLLIGLLVMTGLKLLSGRPAQQLVVISAGMLLANAAHTDYSWRGVFLITLLYVLHSSRLLQILCSGAFMLYEGKFVLLGFLPLLLYNGKRGRQIRYFFYAFYPAHLLVLGVIRLWILPIILR